MKIIIKQRLSVYKKYKLDFWGIVRNSFSIKTLWRKFNYKRLNRKYKMYNEAKFHNLKKTKNKKQDALFGNRLNSKFLYKLKVYTNIIKVVFRKKPSKKLNKICLFFFNRKRRKRNFDWWKKKYFIYEVRDVYVKKKKKIQRKEFIDFRIAKNFYIMYTLKQLKKIVKKAKKKDGLFEQNLIGFLECKLSSFIYRSSFSPNIFESLYYTKKGNLAVNKIYRPNIYFPVKTMDIITFRI